MFDEEELEILQAFEAGSVESSIDAEKEIALARMAAKNTLNKNKSITLRLNMADVAAIKQKAAETGIPYQTLIASVLHQFAQGYVSIKI